MRCLITGVAGFLGSHLAEQLLAKGHEVCGVDAFLDFYPRALKEHNLQGPHSFDTFTCIEANLLEDELLPLFDGVSHVFHLAGQAGVRTSWGQAFPQYVKNNILATQRVLEAARHWPEIKRIVYASSSSVYGEQPTMPLTETMMPCPQSPYGVTKLAGEHLCQLYAQNFGLPTICLRYFSAYGPRQRPDMAFSRFCQAVLTKQPFTIYGSLSTTRDYTYVTDIIAATIQAATCEAASGEVINIAGGVAISLQEVVSQLFEISGRTVPLTLLSQPLGDVEHTLADMHKAQCLLGYDPITTLREGLERQFAVTCSHAHLFA